MTKHNPDRDMAIVSFIEDYARTHGYAPTVREIARGVGLASTSAVHHHMVKLRKSGLLDVSPNRARGIRLGMARQDVETLDLAAELLRADRTMDDLPGFAVPGKCRRPGCRKPGTIRKGKFCSTTCETIAYHVKRWLRDAAIEAESLAAVGAA